MSISREEVERIADLARLGLDEDEIDQFAEELSEVLRYAESLKEVPTDDVEPSIHPTSFVNVLRPDVVRPSLTKEQVLANAPDVEDGHFRVPRVLEE